MTLVTCKSEELRRRSRRQALVKVNVDGDAQWSVISVEVRYPQRDSSCPNCGADLKRKSRRLELESEGLKRMTQELKAVSVESRMVPPGETISERFEIR